MINDQSRRQFYRATILRIPACPYFTGTDLPHKQKQAFLCHVTQTRHSQPASQISIKARAAFTPLIFDLEAACYELPVLP
jgi:hypothetical protein